MYFSFKSIYIATIHVTINSSIYMFAYTQHLKNNRLKIKQNKLDNLLTKIICTKQVTKNDIYDFEEILKN
jgi:hypothetical protein